MKKTLVALVVLASFVFVGCDMLINEIEVHNGLVARADEVAVAEESFYDEYWALTEGGDTTMFLGAYDSFKAAADDLENYMNTTDFTQNQQPMVDEYFDHYKPVLDGYIETAKEFVDEVEKNGYNFDALESYFSELDGYTIDFVSADDTFAAVINALADITNQ